MFVLLIRIFFFSTDNIIEIAVTYFPNTFSESLTFPKLNVNFNCNLMYMHTPITSFGTPIQFLVNTNV